MATKSATERIKDLEEQLAAAREDAAKELRDREAALLLELDVVRAQITEITGEDPKTAKTKGPKKGGKLVSADRLKELLAEAEKKTIRLRDAGLDTDCVKKLAIENPKEFVISGKSPWFSVTLKK